MILLWYIDYVNLIMVSYEHCGYVMTFAYKSNEGSDNTNEHFGFVVV